TAVKTFYVKSDGINPTPDFTVVNHTISAQTPNLVVKQNEALVFNGATSFDHIASTSSSDVGIIKTWLYNWGDGNKTTVGIGENQNVTKTYARAGTFTMLLNTTDVAGRVTTKSIVVQVLDTVAPTVVFNVYRNGTLISGTAQENQTLLFTANGTKDNVDSFSQLNFTWSFGDGQSGYGSYVNHKYANIKTFTVKLVVTDLSGNKANATKSLVITSQPRPDLRIVSVKADPNPMTEGSRGKFVVNVTNVGNANAYSPSVTVSILNSDGSKSTIGTSNVMTNIDNGTIWPGKYGLFEVSWTPSGKGNYTIVTVASVDNEITTSDNTYTSAITVNEATWKAIALYGGIFAVIVVIIVLYYYRKRLPKLGGGKDKKEKEKASSKEESKKQPEEKKSKR
ncbi:MAG: PKD domain-containing protein, partial [Methanomassiliicoccales archaeon]|nr:PKD domain-containing protein [Methanomassiliicoccales archaeon]